MLPGDRRAAPPVVGCRALTRCGAWSEFVTADPATHEALRAAANAVVDALARAHAPPGPRSPLTPEQLKAAADALDPCPPEGAPLEQVLEELAPILDGGIRLGDPARSRTCTRRR